MLLRAMLLYVECGFAGQECVVLGSAALCLAVQWCAVLCCVMLVMLCCALYALLCTLYALLCTLSSIESRSSQHLDTPAVLTVHWLIIHA